ncbi:hypothetical protein [Pseudomonas sp. RIT-PI-S]|uniref:hypothetical protein n=1 Tax=Pseudomonas sp. RIT-PI-S TaxID=3035295 RepID=UPI0021D92535|nr:hypothetical protein [Pseudomonas sp. RIT-PI-S]
MIRITGTIGTWPVDLNIELQASDWAHLQAAVQNTPPLADAAPREAPGHTPTARPAPNDALWQNALALVKGSGQISGPELFEQLEALAGSPAAGKRLLVRLRHCEQVRVQSGGDAPLYTWLGDFGLHP